MIQHSIILVISLIFSLIIPTFKVMIKSHNILMPKNKISLKYTAFLLDYPFYLLKIIREINTSYNFKKSVLINYPKKVHSIYVRLNITKR